MNRSFLISQRVIDTINSLSETYRVNVSSALIGELILGEPSRGNLTGEEALLFDIIRDMVARDSVRVL